MDSNMAGFDDAIYHRQNRYDFEETDFSRRMLRIFFLIDGKKTATQIAELLGINTHILKPEFANLVEMGLIQTRAGIISAGISGFFYSNNADPQVEPTIT